MNNQINVAGPALDRRTKIKLKRRKERVSRMKFCPDCNLVWELIKSPRYPSTGRVEYYPVIPRYGKPDEICPKCKVEKGVA